MSVSPSSSNGGSSLGQVLIERAFSTPPRQMIDGELIDALEGAHATDAAKVVAPVDEEPKPKHVDVRA